MNKSTVNLNNFSRPLFYSL